MAEHNAPRPKVNVEEEAPQGGQPAAPGGQDGSATKAGQAASEGAFDEKQQPAAEGTQRRQKSHPLRDARKNVTGWLTQAFPGHENAVFGGICGLVVAILVFSIGFWQTLFVCVCVLVGVGAGQYADGDPTLLNAVRALFGGRD